MTYADAIQFLYSLRLFGMNPGLANTLKLAALAGNPHEKLRFIHVAGTNGKGSTCAMLESIYRAAGLRVGLFTSPHLVSFRERIQVDRQLVGEEDVVRLVGRVKQWIETGWPQPVAAGFSLGNDDAAAVGKLKLAPTNLLQPTVVEDAPRNLKVVASIAARDAAHPTFFEVLSVMALCYFTEHHCDLVIWETGLGGRLDATNIVTPLASVITNIGFDHQPRLGDTLAQISFEKAGIIKQSIPVVTATDEPEALEVITETARTMKAPLTVVNCPRPTPGFSPEGNLSSAPAVLVPSDGGVGSGLPANLAVPLLGDHQRFNAALAVATVQAIRDKVPVKDEAVRRGLETVQWPGRLQVIQTSPGQTVLLDGAHNAAGADALRAALERYFPNAQPTLVLGVLEDKDGSHIGRTLAPLAGRILLTPVNSDRTAVPESLREGCAKAHPSAELVACSSLAQALEKAANDPFVLITGSLYLVGEAMELLKVSPAGNINERGLNEWRQKK